VKEVGRLFGHEVTFNKEFVNFQQLIHRLKGTKQVKVNNFLLLRAGSSSLDVLKDVRAEYAKKMADMMSFGTFDVSKLTDEVVRLNKIVLANTGGLIQNHFNEEMIQEARLILSSTIYFKANWHTKFDKRQTDPRAEFYCSDNSTKTVEMMYSDEMRVNSVKNDYVHLVELPFMGQEIVMGFALFHKTSPSSSPSSSSSSSSRRFNTRKQMPPSVFTPEQWAAVQKSKSKKKYDSVRIPKFTARHRVKLNTALKAQGVKSIFENAMLTQMLNQNTDQGVASVTQDCVVVVNEDGAEAAAVTSISTQQCMRKTTDFVANRPFLYYILHTPTDTILFSGVKFD